MKEVVIGTCTSHHGSGTPGLASGHIISSHSQMVSVTIYVITFCERVTNTVE